LVDSKISLYAKEYVFCSECGKPDTKFLKEGSHLMLKCEACGSRKPISKV